MRVETEENPAVVLLLGLSEAPQLGSSIAGAQVVVEDVEQYLKSPDVGRFEIVVFQDHARARRVVEATRRRSGASIMISGSEPQDAFTRLLDLGADAFLSRPVDEGQLIRIAAQELRALRARIRRRTDPIPVGQFVGSSHAIREMCEQLSFMAPSNAPVLVTGESGTGKELVARAIHRLSPRRRQPLISVNCGAIPADLIESQLFGHEKGAFTGADRQHIGCFEAAHGGTLFLDEIGELTPSVQVKLLRALQGGGFMRVGGTERISADIRIIAATNSDLAADIASGAFRGDLFYRLNVLSLHLPPLRERRSDVEPLWNHFVEVAALEEGTEPPETTDDALDALETHDWPGNIRELENTARRAVAMRPARSLTPLSLPSQMRGTDAMDLTIRIPGMTLEDLERVAILKTYDATGSVKRAAEILEVSERKIFYRLKEYRDDISEAYSDDRARLAIVEDDPDLRSLLHDLLRASYAVSEFGCVEDLLVSLTVDRPDVIVSDLRLPNRSGLDLLDDLVEREIDVPVILVTGFADDATRSAGLAKGAIAVLNKPVDAISLGRHLERATSAR